jgi:hypothetical protein
MAVGETARGAAAVSVFTHRTSTVSENDSGWQ